MAFKGLNTVHSKNNLIPCEMPGCKNVVHENEVIEVDIYSEDTHVFALCLECKDKILKLFGVNKE